MKLHFDPNQDYQLAAMNAAVGLFDGQPLETGGLAFTLDGAASGSLLNENGVGNRLVINDEQLLENLRAVQKANGIAQSDALAGMHFSIEMETGTGKTYVYLRTMYELNKLYGFTKFVIVVPSIAIREGVLKNLEITTEHFASLYAREPAEFRVYDSGAVSELRSFARSHNIQILVINIDAFAKDTAIINRPNDKLSGKNPIEFIQATHPIVIVDEPQRMETEKRRSAIANLSPLCTLRYSATHLEEYNLIYSLNPVQAYDLGLVKQIEVDSVMVEDGFNQAYVALKGFQQSKTKVKAKLEINTNDKKGVKKKTITVEVGDDLYTKSGKRESYRDGYIINEMDVMAETITLSDGTTVGMGSALGAYTDDVMKMQMRRMVEEHFQKAKIYEPEGIKVLSLVFIDRVANYRGRKNGKGADGKFARWFETLYQEYQAKAGNAEILPYPPNAVHEGYFSQDRKGNLKDTSGETIADESTYDLIMKDKEKLLDIQTPLRFIFSHSALREGWDNPNVFQICTLNETSSEMKKRQEIGRGMRLCVNQDGERIFDRQRNRLTVFANESYEDFAKQLQSEIEEETGVQFSGRIKDRRKREKVQLRKGYHLDDKFLALWEKIKDKTTYRVQFDSEALIKTCTKRISEMPAIHAPRIRVERTLVDMNEEGVGGRYAGGLLRDAEAEALSIPDLIGYIQERTNLTRKTIVAILKESKRLDDALTNPQKYLDQVTEIISSALRALMVDGIKYEKMAGDAYDLMLFEAKEIESYIDNMYTVTQAEKTIVDRIVYDSGIEEQFAKDCENDENVEFFIKLPEWFVIQTPLGTYNPDWALVFKGDNRLYFVAETKASSAGDEENLRGKEKLKIDCGKAHFKEFKDVAYRQVKEVKELY